MFTSLEQDLQKLESRAYHIASWAGDVLVRYHELLPKLEEAAARPLGLLHDWLMVPLTIWPFHIQQVLESCLGALENHGSLERRQLLLIELLPEVPDETVCSIVAEHEHKVQKGYYDDLLNAPGKFDQNALNISDNSLLISQWDAIKAEFDTARFRDHKGVIRRSMSAEHNLRSDFSVDINQQDDVFRAAFDAFCQRWNLYGMQDDAPLLLKMAVNLTPNGTMIFIPSYWSLDAKRDFRWSALNKLHAARVKERQGPKRAESKAFLKKCALKLIKLDQEARRRKIRGQKKHEFLCKGLGVTPETDPKWIRSVRALSKK